MTLGKPASPKPRSRVGGAIASIALVIVTSASATAQEVRLKAETTPTRPVHTYSIVARDPATGELGVAVASRFFAVGSVVPWAKAGVGAVATQSFANTTYGPRGLDLLERGATPAQALAILQRDDGDRDQRQVGIVAADGASITFSGKGCNPWAGGRSGKDYAIQGNILTGEPVVAAMEKAFLASRGTLADRLYASLAAPEIGPRMLATMESEWDRTEAAILAVTGRSQILESSPVLLRSIRLRNPYVDPMSFVQVVLLRRWRELDRESPEAEDVRRVLALSVNGVAAGLQNTG